MGALYIATSICVDEAAVDAGVHYPALEGTSPEERRRAYWYCAYVLFCTSLRSNESAHHALFTNDLAPIRWRGRDLRAELAARGVEIVPLPFREFTPPRELSRSFRNAFYKMDVIRALGRLPDGTQAVLLDADCICPNPLPPERLSGDCIQILDMYKRKDPQLRSPHNLSMADMGALFTTIDPTYPTPYPVRFGGEFVAGSASHLAHLAQLLRDAFDRAVAASRLAPLRFANGQTIFDGCEFIFSYVCNSTAIPWSEASDLVKRIWTKPSLNNTSPEDLRLPFWHLLAEKRTGFQFLFQEVHRENSTFWTVPLDSFAAYLGEFVGVPVRKRTYRPPVNERVGQYAQRAWRKLQRLVRQPGATNS